MAPIDWTYVLSLAGSLALAAAAICVLFFAVSRSAERGFQNPANSLCGADGESGPDARVEVESENTPNWYTARRLAERVYGYKPGSRRERVGFSERISSVPTQTR